MLTLNEMLGVSSSMRWLAVLLDATVKGVVILAAAGAAGLLLRRGSAAVRHLIWVLAAVGLLCLPVLSAALPQLRAPILPRWAASAVENKPAIPEAAEGRPDRFPLEARRGTPPAGIDAAGADEPAPSAASAGPGPVGPASPNERAQGAAPEVPAAGAPEGSAAAPLHWSAWILLAWAAGVLAAAAALFVGTAAVWWRARRAGRVTGETWLTLLRELSDELGIRRPVTLLRNSRWGIPVAWGFRRPVVLLPAESDGWSDQRRRVVLLHELAHVKRSDCMTQLIAQVAFALHWFNPLVWLAYRVLRRERERACDDLVLNAGSKPSEYAGHLVEIVRSLRSTAFPSLAAVAMARKSQFESRLLAILDATRSRRALSRVPAAVALTIGICILLPLAALHPSARSAERGSAGGSSRGNPVASDTSSAERRLQLKTRISLDIKAAPEPKPSKVKGEWAAVKLEWILFELRKGQLSATSYLKMSSYPEAEYRARVELMDAADRVVGRATASFQADGFIETYPRQHERALRFSFGRWADLSRARKVKASLERVRLGPKARGPDKGRIPADAVKIGYVDDTAEGKRSLVASGHAVLFERPDAVRFVEAVQIFASRYGYPQAPREDFHLYLLNQKKQVLADLRFPCGTIERGAMRWYDLRTPSIEVPRRFYLALAFNPHRTKGIYLGLDKSVKTSHSYVGLPDTGFRKAGDYDWMVRVRLSGKPSGAKSIRRLADWKPPKAGDPFAGCLEYRFDAGKSDGKQSYGGQGPAVTIEPGHLVNLAADKTEIVGFRIYAGRYGSGYDPQKTFLKLSLLDPKGTGRHCRQQSFPYALFSYKAGWVDLVLAEPLPLKDSPSPLAIAFDPEATRYKGIYFHYNKDPRTAHSWAGTAAKGFRPLADRQWMVRVYLRTQKEPASR